MPLGAVLVVVAFVSALASESQGPALSVRLGTLAEPSPFPGETLPNVYFVLNYTGHGIGNYTYVLTYWAGGVLERQSQNLLLRSHIPFTFYLSDPLAGQTNTTLRLEVYSGPTTSPVDRVYQGSLAL